MPASWMVNVGGRAYGPYTDAQMAAFAAEGRLAPQSLIARQGEVLYRVAGEEAELAHLFWGTPVNSRPAPGQEGAASEPRVRGAFGKSKEPAQKQGELAQLVIIADMKSRSISGLEEQIHKLGQAYALMPQVWLLRTDQSANAVRNQLTPSLGKLDVLFVIDASNNKAAWFNFGPEAESRIRRIWSRTESSGVAPRMAG
jgi:hypothetical protein